MKFITPFLFLLTLFGCVEDDLTTPRTVSSTDADFIYHDVGIDADMADTASCPVQCSLVVSTPPQQDQVLVSRSVFDACRRVSQELCVDPGEVFKPYVATIFRIERDACEGAPWCVNHDAAMLAFTVEDASQFYPALFTTVRLSMD